MKINSKKTLAAATALCLLTSSPVFAAQGDYLRLGPSGEKSYAMPANKAILIDDVRKKVEDDTFYKELADGKYINPVVERENQMKKLAAILAKQGLMGPGKQEEAKKYLKENIAVVQEALLKATEETPKIERPSASLKVASVSAITKHILQQTDITEPYKKSFRLNLEYKDAKGNVIPAEKLPADLKVNFVDSKDVFNADGTIKNESKIGALGKNITVVATVTSASQNLNLTQEYTVMVVAKGGYREVTDVKMVHDDVNVSVAVVGETIKLLPLKAMKNDGTALDATKNPPDEIKWDNQVKTVESSNVTVLAVALDASSDPDEIQITPISEGTATVTVTLKSGSKYQKSVEVKEKARVAKTAVAEDITLSTVENKKMVKVTVKDQYGDPFKGTDWLYAHPTKIGEETLVTVPVAARSTDKQGEANIPVTVAGTAKSGSDIIKLSKESDSKKEGIGSFNVTYTEADSTVASFELRVAEDSGKSKDLELDRYNASDNTVKLEFIGKDAEGVLAKIYNNGELETTYTVTSSDEDVAKVTIDSDKDIEVKANAKAGIATITVKEGNIVRAMLDVTVKDSTPSVGAVAVKPGAKIYVNSGKTDTSDDVIITDTSGNFYKHVDINSLIEVKNGSKTYTLAYNSTKKVFEVKDDMESIGKLEVFSTDKVNLPVTGGSDGVKIAPADAVTEDSNGSIVFKLLQGDVAVNTVAVPVVFDETKPKKLGALEILSGDKNGLINKEEKTAGLDVKVPLDANDTEVGDVVQLKLGGNKKAEHVVKASDLTSGSVTVKLEASDVAAGNLTATLTDQANNESDASNALALTVDEDGPSLANNIATNDNATKIEVTVTEAGDVLINETKVNTGEDTVTSWEKTDENKDLTAITVAEDLSSGGKITFTLKDASSGGVNGHIVKVNLAQLRDKAGNPLVNANTAKNTVITITADSTQWKATLAAE